MNGKQTLIPLWTASLVVFGSIRAEAQDSATAVLAGVVRDQSSGLPVPYVEVLTGRTWSFTDSLGRFEVKVPDGDYDLYLMCFPSRRSFGGRRIGPLEEHAGKEGIELIFDSSDCSEPPVERWREVFEGFHYPGFESSTFRSCTPIRDLSDTGYGESDPDAWVTFGVSVASEDWPDLPTVADGSARYLKARGWMEGPGGYGHLSGATYLFTVDSVLDYRRVRPSDCGQDSVP